MNSRAEIERSALAKNFARKRHERGWWSRNWLWFLPVLLLGLIVLGGAAAYWSLFLRVYRLEVCRATMELIQADKTLEAALGHPIQAIYRPSREAVPNARIEEDEIEVLWNVEGPKGSAKARSLAKRRQGKWETVLSEVVLANGRKVSLAAAGEDDAPAFEPIQLKDLDPARKDNPPPAIDLLVPPGGAPQ